MLLKNCNAYIGGEFVRADILIQNGLITRIDSHIEHTNDMGELIALDGKLVSAGFIDIHQHWREPGYGYKETIKSASLACAKGGITTAMQMPNLKPVPDTLQSLSTQLELLSQSVIKALPYGAITKGEKGEELADMDDMTSRVFAFSDDGRGVQNAMMMKQAMLKAKSLGKHIISHCEDMSLVNGGHMHDGTRAKELGVAGIPSSSESVQVARDMLLAQECGASYHVCHISAWQSVAMVEAGKRLGVNISCEVTPHHLISCDNDIPSNDGMWKMNPPLRSAYDQEYLIKALNDGIIEVIATDHAPHSDEEKQGSFEKSYFGIIGSEFAFSLLYTHLVCTGKVSLGTILDAFSTNPKRIFGLDMCGELKVGSRADIVCIDLDKKWLLDKQSIVSMGKNTPYLGSTLQSQVILTIVDGKIIYQSKD